MVIKLVPFSLKVLQSALTVLTCSKKNDLWSSFINFDSRLIEFDLEDRSMHEIQVDTCVYITSSTFSVDETRIPFHGSNLILKTGQPVKRQPPPRLMLTRFAHVDS